MAEVQVSLGERSYTIHIGNEQLANFRTTNAHKLNKQLFIITNPTVSQYYLKPLLNVLTDHHVDFFEMRDGGG